MLLNNYIDNIKNALDKIIPFIINHSLTIDKRPQQQVHIVGILIFIDESNLHFREFINASEGWIEKVAYSYHFQDKTNNLLFRYDNAKHKPALNFEEHKHYMNEIMYAPAPTLQQIIEEIIVMQQLI